MSRARATISRFAARMAPVALAALAAGWPLAAAAQQAGGLRGALASDTVDPLRPPGPAEPLAPLKPAPLSARSAIAPAAAPARPRKQAEDLDDELAGASDDDGSVDAAARARQRARDTLPDPTVARRPTEAPATTTAAKPASGTKAAKPARQLDTQTSTGTVPTKSIDAADLERNIAARPTGERATPIEGLGRPPEQSPFEPPGMRVGTFLLRPTLDQGIEWTSNATNTAGGSSDFVSDTTLRLDAASDWARHSASLDAYGTYRTSVTGSGFSEFRGAANAALGLDLGNALRLDTTLGYERKPEDASSPVDITGAIGRPLRQTLSASAGLEKAVGKLPFGLTGAVSRDTYGDVALAAGVRRMENLPASFRLTILRIARRPSSAARASPGNTAAGGTLSQADRNQTLYSMVLRGGYEVSPALTPFVEAELGRRLYDNATDSSGYSRSANRYGARAGLAFDLGEKLNGEVSAGWLSEKPDDARLSAVSGLSAAGNVQWSPVRGTIVSLTGSTQVEGSTTPGQSGSILYSSTLGVSRELRANLTGAATVGADWRRYAGTGDRDLTWSTEASLTWWLWRYAGIKARARHEQTTSTIAGRDSQTDSIYLGVTLRR